MRSCTTSLAVLSLTVFLTGCNESGIESVQAIPDPAAIVAVNDLCPIMGGNVTKDGGTASWKGKTIGFCCPECIEQWEALSEADKETKLASADKNNASHDHDHAQH